MLRLRVIDNGRVGVQTLAHLVADDVDEPLEDRLYVDVLLRRRLEELKSCRHTKRKHVTCDVDESLLQHRLKNKIILRE